MAGERLAKLTVRVALSHNDVVRGTQTTKWRFRLGNQVLDFYRGGQPGQFVVPDPDEPGVGEQYGLQTVQHVLALLGARIFSLGLPWQVGTPTQVGTAKTYYDDPTPAPVIEFTVTATEYGAANVPDFEPSYQNDATLPNTLAVAVLTNISPIFATATHTDATYYGATDGSIEVTATGGNGGAGYYFYKWSDGANTATRAAIGAGTYECVVTDGSGASATVSVTVLSDARLDVQVQQAANNVQLVVSGGLAPYDYLWDDGPTTATRTGLAAGTYACTVTDARGRTETVTVTVSTQNVFFFSRNPVTLTLKATSLSSKPGLVFLCEVYIEQDYLSGKFTSVAGVLRQPADAQGATTFDVSTLLDAYVQPDFPAHSQTGAQRADKVFKRFYLQHSEQWTGSGNPTYTVRQTHYLVYGGLDFFEYATQAYFTVYRPAVKPFLTWEPPHKEVFADQPEYLYYHHDSLSDATFKVQVSYTRASGATGSRVLAQPTTVACFEVWRLGVGLPQLRAELGPQLPADVVAWRVQVLDASGAAVSETRHYQLSDELPGLRRYFLYANSVGGINTLATVGKAKTETDFASVLVQRSLRAGYDASQGETYTASSSGVPVQRVATGHLGPAQMEALQDFLLSEEIRRWDADRYTPGSLQPASTQLLTDDDEGLLSVEFAFVLPTQRRYTPRLPLHY